MIDISFCVDGPLYGYRSSRDRMVGKHRANYTLFQHKVLVMAMTVGWKGAAVSLKERPPILSVKTFWRRGPRIDWSNVYKAVEDALFVQDRFVLPGKSNGVEWNTGGREYVEVKIIV